MEKKFARVKFFHGDALEQNMEDANIVYLASVCFPDPLIEKLHVYAQNKFKKGTRIVSFRALTETSRIKLIDFVRVNMSWGENICYFYQMN
jgi:hypothetical protein